MIAKICILGLGHIGLPLACLLADRNYVINGVDTNAGVRYRLNKGILSSPEANLQELLRKALQKRTLNIGEKPSEANIFVIAVPTPLDAINLPDTSLVAEAVQSIFPHLRAGNLVVIESTCPMGTTDQIAKQIRVHFPEVHVAYCPERVLPGNILDELVYNARVIGGVDDASTRAATEFYQSFVKGAVHSTTAKMAEAVKLAENTFRDINIAFANELSMIADHVNLDVNEWIRLANHHPRVNILQPGAGVGGHCIAVDPWFLAAAAPEMARLTSTAREVNLRKTDWVVDRIREAIRKHDVKSITCLGLTYKANVADIRESPAMFIVERMKKEIRVHAVDPYVSHSAALNEALQEGDLIVGLVAHREFLAIPKERLSGKVVLDFGGLF